MQDVQVAVVLGECSDGWQEQPDVELTICQDLIRAILGAIDSDTQSADKANRYCLDRGLERPASIDDAI